MHNKPTHRFLRAETVTAFCIIVVAAAFLIPTTELAPLSALLPAVMLGCLILLAIVMLIADQRKASAGEEAEAVLKSPKRVFGAFGLITLYAICVGLIGFYISTALSLPLVAYIFGYRSPVGLAIATAIVLLAIYLIFGVSMSQEFPTGLLWAK
ncbi:tripartite tricarboxylate transporter TctB family protein [uncultured Cohaesibacter sp.]|uniref:tripartite tricarboxylate transporter TctB family protein n=1 Tax=uncultured Cohaesibacter sp. TaxID=1002546 RepID=UPI002A0A7A25|nr:tripartite tricarboxylate transporter TctB family protein [uncultured Cohaesibacter sp.]